MNITRDFFSYIRTVKKSFNLSNFSFKTDKNGKVILISKTLLKIAL